MTIIAPQNFAELSDAMMQIVADKTPITIAAMGTKQGLGKPVQTSHHLDISALAGVMDYEPEELIITAHAATPLAEIEALLAQHNQMLAFEPPHLDRLYGTASTGTIGGALLANLSGPRRLSQGAARDFLLGFEGVSGRGTGFRSGSKVVKNVTGYDLSKLLCGSFGTLAVIDEITLKTLPAPETSLSLIVANPDLERVAAAARAALKTAYEPSATAVLPKGAHEMSQSAAIAVIRFEGVAVSVNDRFEKLQKELAAFGHTDKLAQDASLSLWRDIADVALLDHGHQIWRISMAPSQGPAILEQIEQQMDVAAYFDWAGGLLWLSCDKEDAHQIIRKALHNNGGGHATLMRGSDELRETVPVFEPLAIPLAALNKRVQDAFDPHGLLNPGRL